MSTRSSARIAALSPPPTGLSPFNAALPPKSRSNIAVSSMPWTQRRLDEYRAKVVDTSDLSSLVPKTDKESLHSQGGCIVDGIGSAMTPEGLFSSGDGSERDFLIRAFFENLGVIQQVRDGEGQENAEGYTRQLFFDFMRILVLANKETLNANVQMMFAPRPVFEYAQVNEVSPPRQTTFDIGESKYIVASDGSFGVFVNESKKHRTVKNVPVSFEVSAPSGNEFD